jgi:hypothetical protein
VKAEPTTSADAANLTPPDASRAAVAGPDVRSAFEVLASALAFDANTCVDLLHDEICESTTPRLAGRLSALVALVQRMGWMADELARASRDDGPCLNDDIGWFTRGTDDAAARVLRGVATGGAR